jgi:hypothetical protein
MTPLTIIQREYFRLDVILKSGEPLAPIDLTGATVAAQIRKDWNMSQLAEISASIEEPEEGKLSFSMAGTESVKIPPGNYKYDAFLTRDGVTTRILWGEAKIVGAITRP